jgi:hypothetical protein
MIPKLRRSSLALLAVIAVLVLVGACTSIASNEKVEALELAEVSGYWAVRGKVGERNYIHPVVRFRVRNTSSDEVDHVQAMAIFRQTSEPEIVWTSVYKYSIAGKPLSPGETSPLVFLAADTHYYSTDPSEQMLGSEDWIPVTAEIFLKVGGSD